MDPVLFLGRFHVVVLHLPIALVPIAQKHAAGEEKSVLDRLSFVGGDMFADVPAGDVYIMKHIIHDWDDERALSILKNIKKAMNPGGRVLVVEAVIAEGNNQDFGKLLDIEMLGHTCACVDRADAAIALMQSAGISQLPVLQNGKPVGSIQEVTLARLLHDNIDPAKVKVGEIMAQPLPALDLGVHLDEAYRLLLSGNSGVLVTASLPSVRAMLMLGGMR